MQIEKTISNTNYPSMNDTVQATTEISETDIENFIDVSHDDNPIHTDNKVASSAGFKQRVVHGSLVLSRVSAALGSFPFTIIYKSQSFNFINPVFPGDTLNITCRITAEGIKDNEYIVDVYVQKEGGNGVIGGTVTLYIPN